MQPIQQWQWNRVPLCHQRWKPNSRQSQQQHEGQTNEAFARTGHYIEENVPKVRFALPERLEGVMMGKPNFSCSLSTNPSASTTLSCGPSWVPSRSFTVPFFSRKIDGMESGHALARIQHVCKFNEHIHSGVASSMCACSRITFTLT